MKGTVKWFNGKKGYGFITDESNNDVFVHYTAIQSDAGFKTLKDGAEVEFDVVTKEDGKTQAMNVKEVAAS